MRRDRLNAIEVVVADPSPQWTSILIDGEEKIHGLSEEQLVDSHLLLGRAIDHVRKINEYWRG